MDKSAETTSNSSKYPVLSMKNDNLIKNNSDAVCKIINVLSAKHSSSQLCLPKSNSGSGKPDQSTNQVKFTGLAELLSTLSRPIPEAILPKTLNFKIIPRIPPTLEPFYGCSKLEPWYQKKPMLRYLLTLLCQPEKYSKYIHWISPASKNIDTDPEGFIQDSMFGMFQILAAEDLSRLWATIREKRIVSSVKDGFFRNLRLYYEKKNKNGTVQPGVIRPVKRLFYLSGGETKKMTDTWQFESDGLASFMRNKDLYKSYATKDYPRIPKIYQPSQVQNPDEIVRSVNMASKSVGNEKVVNWLKSVGKNQKMNVHGQMRADSSVNPGYRTISNQNFVNNLLESLPKPEITVSKHKLLQEIKNICENGDKFHGRSKEVEPKEIIAVVANSDKPHREIQHLPDVTPMTETPRLYNLNQTYLNIIAPICERDIADRKCMSIGTQTEEHAVNSVEPSPCINCGHCSFKKRFFEQIEVLTGDNTAPKTKTIGAQTELAPEKVTNVIYSGLVIPAYSDIKEKREFEPNAHQNVSDYASTTEPLLKKVKTSTEIIIA